MGAYAPAAVATPEVLEAVRKTIVEPTLAGLEKEGIDYRGTLYVGIMITARGPKVVEFNVRFGDPECQVLMPLLASDPLEMLYDTACGKLDASKVKIADGFAAVVVVCAKGYPGKYKKGEEISLPEKTPPNTQIIHAGTKLEGGKIVSAGGRVLGLTGFGKTLEEALSNAYSLAGLIKYEGGFFRRDIAHRELERRAAEKK